MLPASRVRPGVVSVTAPPPIPAAPEGCRAGPSGVG
jgi:hypothetical protein